MILSGNSKTDTHRLQWHRNISLIRPLLSKQRVATCGLEQAPRGLLPEIAHTFMAQEQDFVVVVEVVAAAVNGRSSDGPNPKSAEPAE